MNEALKDAKMIAMRYLLRREHSRVELMQKMLRKGVDEVIAEQACDVLEDKDFLSDMRFAQAFINTKARAGYGQTWIAAALRSKGLTDVVAASAFDECGIDWYAVAAEALERKQRQAKGLGRQKYVAFLLRKGHRHEDAYAAVSDAGHTS